MVNVEIPTSILVVPNQAGDGATSFTRDLAEALSSLKQPKPKVVALDYSTGELWRQSKLQAGFKAYPGLSFEAAWMRLKVKSRLTDEDDSLGANYKEMLSRDIHSDIDYLLMDSKSKQNAPFSNLVLLVARCDPRNLATLRANYQALTNVNPNTYIVLTQGSSEGYTSYVTNALRGKLVEKGVKTLRSNGKPLVIPHHNEAYSMAAKEGLPVFRLPKTDFLTEEDLLDMRSIHHDAATEVRRILKRTELEAKRVSAAEVA